jgi:hypothetical protein
LEAPQIIIAMAWTTTPMLLSGRLSGDLDFHIDWSYNDDYVAYIEPSQNATAKIES